MVHSDGSACGEYGPDIDVRGPDAEFMAHARADIPALIAEVRTLRGKIDGYDRECHEVEQTLGKVLGYPWYKDSLDVFPDATEAEGVCTGEHVPASIAAEAAGVILRLRAENAALRSVANAAAVLVGNHNAGVTLLDQSFTEHATDLITAVRAWQKDQPK
jgi:hypothetical protein